MTTIREDYALQVTRVNTMVDNLAEIENNMEYMGEDGEDDEKNGEVRNLSRKDDNAPHELNSELLENKVNRLVTNKFDELRKDQSALNQDSDLNCLTKIVKDSIKFEIVNKSMNVKWDYKLTTNMKFEHFYDYLSSQLRSHGLLHIIDEKITSDVRDEKLLKEQKFRVRAILINHLDSFYYSKVMHLQNPGEILDKLRELKSCETNITSHAVQKKLYSMQYVIGKMTAVEF